MICCTSNQNEMFKSSLIFVNWTVFFNDLVNRLKPLLVFKLKNAIPFLPDVFVFRTSTPSTLVTPLQKLNLSIEIPLPAMPTAATSFEYQSQAFRSALGKINEQWDPML